ncbi:MAG: hypothetical protein KAI74_03930, partial [Kiritimatiellae bacterium]|nr:hypothetical protein [Kiritimatiellia bacterium]
MKKIIYILMLLVGIAGSAIAQFDDPFTVSVALDKSSVGAEVVVVSFTVPDVHHLYKDVIVVKATDGISLKA